MANEINVPPVLKAKLNRLGLSNAYDFALHFPLRYEDETRIVPIASAANGGAAQVEVDVQDVSVQFRPRPQLVEIGRASCRERV